MLSCLFTGLEDQFEQVKFPTGKVSVDGFICVVDVSRSQTRTLEGQLDFVGKVLSALMKTKKPIVVAASKMDEGSDAVLLVSCVEMAISFLILCVLRWKI